MILNKDSAVKIAESLLQIKAIKLNPTNPFQWASGWNSPIYCDNRKTLSYPPCGSSVRMTPSSTDLALNLRKGFRMTTYLSALPIMGHICVAIPTFS